MELALVIKSLIQKKPSVLACVLKQMSLATGTSGHPGNLNIGLHSHPRLLFVAELAMTVNFFTVRISSIDPSQGQAQYSAVPAGTGLILENCNQLLQLYETEALF
jgi:hypothetical protein